MADAFSAIFGEETKKPAFSGDLVAPKKSPFANVNSQLQAEDDFDVMLSNAAKQPKQPQQPASSQPNALQRFGQGMASLGDVTIGGVLPMAGPVAQAVVRPFTSPQRAEEIGQQISSAVDKPFGKAFGVTETPGYKGEASQQLMNFIGQNVSKGADWIAQKTGLPVQDVNNMLGTLGIAGGAAVAKPLAGATQKVGQAAFNLEQAFTDKVKSATPKVRIEPQATAMQPAGAAASTNQTMLNEAINRASPELAAELKAIDPATVNPQVLENYVKADQFGIKLTKGQATGDPNLISVERNERGLKPQLAEEYAKQNRALAEKAEEIKQKTAEGTFEPDYVANAERAIEAYKEINTNTRKVIKQAYDDIDELGAGKIQVDGKAFGENAMNALSLKEDIDFLPETIKKRVVEYKNGKEMNFDQFDNFDSQISREIRKAQIAKDGNAVHALTIVKGELQKLPLINETAEAKVVADKARLLAAKEFGLLDKRSQNYNPVYADVVNGGADTSNFIPKVVIRSKNTDFAKAIDMLKDNPDAIKQLRAGTLDYIISKSKDASGNFSNAKFNQFVGNLDVNKKLTALFGEDATQIKDLADVARLVEAQPKGSFVSTANTAPAAAQLAKEYGLRMAKKTPLVGGLVEPAMQIRAERQMAKEVQETLRPGAGAGTKLKNLGKDKK